MSVSLKEMKSRLDKKYSILPHLYNYMNDITAQCIFFEMDESDDINDMNAKEAENTLVTIFGSDDFKAFNTTSQFIKSFDQAEEIHKAIVDKWQSRAREYIISYLQDETHIKNGYFFMFLPKSL